MSEDASHLFPDLPGRFTMERSNTSSLPYSGTAVRVVGDYGPTAPTTIRKTAAMVMVTDELLDDGPAVSAVLQHVADRWFRPWKYPDRNPMPVMDLFPRLTTAEMVLRQTVRLKVRA